MVAFIFLIAGVLLFLWSGRGRPVLLRGEWRLGAGLLSIGALVGAALVSIRGDWEVGLGLLAVGLGLLAATRLRRGRSSGQGGGDRLSLAEARSVLGVTAEATEAEIRSAYARLMRMAHPDHGGTNGLAAQLNAARDRLLGER